MPPANPDVYSFDWTFPMAFIWGLLVLMSLVGWGRSIDQWLVVRPEGEDFGWGISAAWGLAAFLVLSGPMLMLSLFSSTFVTLFLMAGWGLQARCHWSMRKDRKPWKDPLKFGFKIFAVFLGLLILLTYTAAVAAREYDQFDDLAAYFYLTRKMLDLGTVYDPFSYRMLGALGGQLALSTLVFTYLPWKYANLLDYGIAGLIVLGLTQEFVRGNDGKVWAARLLLLLLALTFPMPHTNTGSEYTGVVLFMALLYSFDLVATGRLRGWRAAVLVGGVATAAATLRCHNVFTVALLGLGFVTWRLRYGGMDRRIIARESLLLLIIATAFIVPWWVVSYRSGGTFLYPLFKGNHQPQFQIFEQDTSFLDNLQFTFGFYTSTAFLLLFIPVCFLKIGSQQRALLISGGIIFFISFIFLLHFNMGTDMYVHAYRYLVPIGLAFGLYTSGIIAQQFLSVSLKTGQTFWAIQTRFAKTTAIVIIFLQTLVFMVTCIQNIVAIRWATNSHNQIWCPWVGPVNSNEAQRDYPKAFACIPAGAKVFIAVDYPFLLNNRTHAIFSVDVAGAASPAPGLPYFRGSKEVEHYLRAQGFQYIANVPFERSRLLHSRKDALVELAVPKPFYQLVGSHKMEFMNNIDEIAKTNPIIYDSSTLRVIALKE